MNLRFSRSQIALAVSAALCAATMSTLSGTASAERDKDRDGDSDRDRGNGTYVSGDFHNHTTCSDGSISMQKLVKKATDTVDTPWGLDWFVQAGHGNSGATRNCTLVEDATLSTPAYPFVSVLGPQTTWANSIGAENVKGDGNGAGGAASMWRWQSVQED